MFTQSVVSKFSLDRLSSTILRIPIFRCCRNEDPLTLSSDVEIGYTRIEIIRADLKQFTGGASLCTYVSPHYDAVYIPLKAT